MRRRRSGTTKVVDMASISRLPKRRLRSTSSTTSVENHGEEELKGEMDERDLDLVTPNKRMRSLMSLQVCDTREEGQVSVRTGGDGDGGFEIEPGEDTGELVAKSSMKVLNLNQHGLRSRQLLVSKTSNFVIGAQVPRKARSGIVDLACVKRSLQEYPASGCYSDQPHSDLEAGENGKRNGECKSTVGKGCKLSSSVDEDIEMEVAEALFSLMNQSRRPENVRDSQQKRGVSLVKEPEQINGEIKLLPGKNKPQHVDKTGSSELKLLDSKVPVGVENTQTSVVDERLVEESKKDKSLSHTILSIESGNSVYSKENQMAPFVGYLEGALEIDFLGTKGRTPKLLQEVTIGKPEKLMTEMRSLSVGATRNAQITLSDSFPASNDSSPASCSKGHLQPRESIAFMDKATEPFKAGQPRLVYQHDRKRCATHYYIAQSIMNHHHCNLLSSKERSACGSVNGSFTKYVSEKQPQGLILNGNMASKSRIVTNPTCPQDNEVVRRTQHLHHKAPQVSSSEKTMYQMVGSKAELSGTHAANSSQKTASPMRNSSAAGDVTTYSSFRTMDPSMRLYRYNTQQVTNKGPHFMTIIPSNDYTLPISASVGNSESFKGRVHGNVMPFLNGSVGPPQMFYPPLGSQQSTHTQPLGMQQHGLNVSGRTFIQSAAMHSPYPQKNHVQSFYHSHKPEAETPDRNSVCPDQKSAENHHGQVPLQQMHFTTTPMATRNNYTRKLKNQEFVQGSKADFEPPASQAASLSYSSFDGSSLPSELSLTLPGQNVPFLPNLADIAHRRNLDSKTAGAVYKKYQVEAKSCIGITGADSARKCFTGNPKEIPYDQTAMLKGCSIFDTSAKTPNLYTAFQSANSQSHYGVQQQHNGQGKWNMTSATDSQPSPAMSTNVPYNPLVIMAHHPAHWSSKGSSQCTQSASTIPSFSLNSPHQLVPPYGGNNDKAIPAQGNQMSVMHRPTTLANNQHTPSQKSCQSLSVSAVLPSCEPNGAGPNSSSQQKSSSPVCRIVVPSILSTRPSQVSEVKN